VRLLSAFPASLFSVQRDAAPWNRPAGQTVRTAMSGRSRPHTLRSRRSAPTLDRERGKGGGVRKPHQQTAELDGTWHGRRGACAWHPSPAPARERALVPGRCGPGSAGTMRGRPTQNRASFRVGGVARVSGHRQHTRAPSPRTSHGIPGTGALGMSHLPSSAASLPLRA